MTSDRAPDYLLCLKDFPSSNHRARQETPPSKRLAGWPKSTCFQILHLPAALVARSSADWEIMSSPQRTL